MDMNRIYGKLMLRIKHQKPALFKFFQIMALEKHYHLLLYFFLALLPFSTVAQTYRNISLDSSLTAQADNNSFWPSPSGDFAFGFQQIVENGFILAIWFNRIPERTIVWSANGQNLAPKGSKIELTSNGLFLLNDPSGKQIWSATSSGSGTSYAAMLDTGNFVLAGKDSQFLWQSFNQPTDTILPGQVLNQPSSLYSRYMETNYSSGRFQFILQDDGNLVLYTTDFPFNSPNFAYWTTQVFGSDFLLVFNQTGYIFLQANNGSIINMISSNASSTQDFYQRAILEYDGVFRHYVYPKNSTSSSTGKWQKAWSTVSFIPSNICLRITEATGSGACGFNSYCTLDEGKSCHCPPGYSFIDSGDVMKGCKQDFDSQSCDESFPETDLFDFIEMENTDWPLSDYEHFQSVTEDWCRQACLGDCFCAVAIFRNGECWKKKLPLSNGRLDPTVGGKALIKTRKDNSTMKSSQRKNDQSKLIIVGSVLLSSSLFLNLLLSVTAFLVASRFVHRNSKVNQSSQFMEGMYVRRFTYEELNKATNGFKEELGRGAFSTVYKGVLLDLTGNRLIAVKKLNNMVQESEEEFKTEVRAIARTNHRNLVQLLGFCNQGEHRLLVYEFMSKGTLASFLFESQRPSWFERMQIALGTARGLLYLHEECSTQIIHCDIKPQNVLLEDSCTAKISDFGLAKLLKIDQLGTTTGIRGTKGYVAPEWFRNMPITIKVDVYSYGILLLEIICCRRSFETKAEDENQMILTDWAYDCFQERKLDLLMEDEKEALDDMKMVEKYVMVALWCIQEDPSLRPTMKSVLEMLEGSIDVPMLPDPPSFTSSM